MAADLPDAYTHLTGSGSLGGSTWSPRPRVALRHSQRTRSAGKEMTMPHDLSAEKRQTVRIGWDATVVAHPIPQTIANDRWQGLTQDISEGGMRLSCGTCVPVGSRLLMSLDQDMASEPIRAIGTVVWISQLPYQDRWSVGVEFASLAEHERARLRGLMRKH